MQDRPGDWRRRAQYDKPAPGTRGAAYDDHFGLLWELTPYRSPTSPQVNTRRPVQHR